MDTKIDQEKTFLSNPDVNLREEDEDGGLLYNPDTNQVKVLNTTGLFIWKQFQKPNHTAQVMESILQNFEDAAPDVVQTDLDEFVQGMLQSGFIGEVKD